jgi:hypothetical protein
MSRTQIMLHACKLVSDTPSQQVQHHLCSAPLLLLLLLAPLSQVTNVLVLDENPAGLEGPWVTYARMVTLRTNKALTGATRHARVDCYSLLCSGGAARHSLLQSDLQSLHTPSIMMSIQIAYSDQRWSYT